ELLITVLRSMAASRGQVIAATPFGKTKTVLQVAAVLLLILERPYPLLDLPTTITVALAVVFTVLSGLGHLWRLRHVPSRPEDLALRRTGGGARELESWVEPQLRRLHERLVRARATLAVAESCTGGLLAAAITDQPGSSSYFKGGVVAYSNEIKERLLGVAPDLLRRYGAVSAEAAQALAEGARSRFGADLAVAITGIAGPDADGTAKPT